MKFDETNKRRKIALGSVAPASIAVTGNVAVAAASTNSALSLSHILDEILIGHVFAFVGVGSFRYVAGTNLRFYRLYHTFLEQQKPEQFKLHEYYGVGGQQDDDELSRSVTIGKSIVESVSCAKLCWKEICEQECFFFDNFHVERGEDGCVLAASMITILGCLSARYENLTVLQWALQNYGIKMLDVPKNNRMLACSI